jgi:di/tricarboxylate transporter
MSTQIAAIVVLALMFILATFLPVNMGALALVGAFIIGLLAHMPARDIFAGFPGDLFVTLVGITYLFAIANNNGTIDWLVQKAVWLVRGHVAAIPWVMFVVAAVLTSVGAVSPAAVAIIAPIALRFADKYKLSPLLMGLMVIHGAQAGGFSPIGIYGGITNQIVERANLPRNDLAIFLASFLFNFAVAVLVFLLFRRYRAPHRKERIESTIESEVPLEGSGVTPASFQMSTTENAELESEHRRLDWYRALTLTGLVTLAVGTLVFELNVGLVAMSVAVVLALLAPHAQKRAVDQVSWSTVLLITGVVTYIAVLQKVGTVDLVGNSVSGMGAPLIGALLLCYIAGIVSAFASSIAVLGATIPLAVPFLLQGQVHAVGVVAAIAISTTIVDVSPFSTNGALVVANSQGVDKEVFYRQMLMYSGVVVLVGPLLTWLVLILPGWL